MVRTRVVGQLAALVVAGVLLTGCGPNARGQAEDILGDHLRVSVDAMGESLLVMREGDNLEPSAFQTVASGQALLGLSDLPSGEASSTMYCLERDADVVSACVFYPLTVYITAGLGTYESSVYGCASLTGRQGETEVVVEDIDCPTELVDWFIAKRNVEDAEPVSIQGLVPNE